MKCKNCRGYGYTYYGPPESRKQDCGTCKGKGEVEAHFICSACKGGGGVWATNPRNGYKEIVGTCPTCSGTGYSDVRPEVAPDLTRKFT